MSLDKFAEEVVLLEVADEPDQEALRMGRRAAEQACAREDLNSAISQAIEEYDSVVNGAREQGSYLAIHDGRANTRRTILKALERYFTAKTSGEYKK